MEIENHTPTMCCNHVYPKSIPYPVYWNESNNVVQCHACGQVYTPTDYKEPLEPGTNT